MCISPCLGFDQAKQRHHTRWNHKTCGPLIWVWKFSSGNSHSQNYFGPQNSWSPPQLHLLIIFNLFISICIQYHSFFTRNFPFMWALWHVLVVGCWLPSWSFRVTLPSPLTIPISLSPSIYVYSNSFRPFLTFYTSPFPHYFITIHINSPNLIFNAFKSGGLLPFFA